MGMIAEFYEVWDTAFWYFNAGLFDGTLPEVGFTVEKQKGSRAYFHANQFIMKSDGSQVHKISMGSGSLERPDRDSMGTFVHEMAHRWQQVHGKPGRGKYHNAEWAAKMRTLGLSPKSHTTGDKGTGDRVTHEIVDGGPFDRRFVGWEQLGLTIGWHGQKATVTQQTVAKKRSKTKYTCPGCGANVWGKSGMYLYDDCEERFVEAAV